MECPEVEEACLSKSSRKLAVLDLDNTLCDFNDIQEGSEINVACGRPFLHIFLAMVYEYFDIIIWSATDHNTILSKLNYLDIASCNEYTIMECMDNSQMKVQDFPHGARRVKSLVTIWTKYPVYDQTNTIMIDDQYMNFADTPNNGLQIKPYFRGMHGTDIELIMMGTYLQKLATYSRDFSQENQKGWKEYNPK